MSITAHVLGVSGIPVRLADQRLRLPVVASVSGRLPYPELSR
jgi:hypothetical protein